MAKDPMDTPNSDLDTRDNGNDVEGRHEVRAKTTPNLRHDTRVDNNAHFEADFTVRLDDDGNVPASEKERNETAVRTQALQRGLVPTGAVRLTKTEKLGDGRTVRLVYAVPVELNGPDADTLPGVAAAEQHGDTPAELPEKLDKKGS